MNVDKYLMQRVETLEAENAELKSENRLIKAENNRLTVENIELNEARNRLGRRYGSILSDNRRLMRINEGLAASLGVEPAEQRFDADGNLITDGKPMTY